MTQDEIACEVLRDAHNHLVCKLADGLPIAPDAGDRDACNLLWRTYLTYFRGGALMWEE